MKKRRLFILLLAWAVSVAGVGRGEVLEFTYCNPNPQVLMRDTQIIANPQDGKFYAVGTLFWGVRDAKGDAGFRLYVSDDLKEWKAGPWLLKQSEIPAAAWYRDVFWAPELHFIGGKWYFTYNCDGTRAYDRERYCANHGSGISVADQITGPYRILSKEPLTPWPSNDLTLFQDDDGKVYAFFNDGFFNMKKHPEAKHSIYVAEMDLEKGVLREEPRKLLTQQEGFEAMGIEGAHVVKQDGIYYLFYSGWKDGYAVGYATATRVTGPYTRAAANPLFGARHDGTLIQGGKLLKDVRHPYREIGHNQVFKGPDGHYWTSCHAYLKDGDHQFGSMLIMDRLEFDHGTVITGAPTWTPQRVPIAPQMLERFPGLRLRAQEAGRALPAPASPPAAAAPPKPKGQELLIPADIYAVPAGNDYHNPASEFCFKRSKASEHFVLFWAKEYGDDPKSHFNAEEVLREADRIYDYYMDTLKWVDKERSLAARYKFLIFVLGGSGGTAFGGCSDNKVGTFWTPASRIAKGPYGVVAHELGHSFQALTVADGAAAFPDGIFGEMTSQFMLWQVYPEWQSFENYHLHDFMRATHLAFLHPDNQYHSCYPLEYWSLRHGPEIIGKLWREVRRGEDAVMTYQRLTGISQAQFNNEMFDACRRFVTWDLPRVEKVAARHANRHTSAVLPAGEGWFQVAAGKCPQDYGYNAIRLNVPAAGSKLALAFKGMAGAEGGSRVRLDKAGWRYGFLAHLADGSRVYSDTFAKADGTAEFTVPANTRFLWLVVMGAPAEHSIRTTGKGGGAGEQWPYAFRLTGTVPADAVIEKRPRKTMLES